MMKIEEYLEDRRKLVDKALDSILMPADCYPQPLHEAVRYCVLTGGKRLRPILTIAAGEAVGGSAQDVLSVALSIELIHCCSLVYDDLPCMDDADFRRGKPACHKAFSEAIAILAGHCLLTRAYSLLFDEHPAGRLEQTTLKHLVREFEAAVGSQGMAGGQAVELLLDGKAIDIETLRYIRSRKTGALIRLSVLSGGIICGAGRDTLKCLSRYGDSIGLAFQIKDDLLGLTETAEHLGKPAEADRRGTKETYHSTIDTAASEKEIKNRTREAIEAVKLLGDGAWALRAIAKYMASRQR